MMESMQTPMTRAEFEYRFNLLREQIHQQKLQLPRGETLGLDKVRYLPNGRIDFLSVNELARLQANMTAHYNSEKIKTILDKQETQDDSIIESTLGAQDKPGS